jgi:hypothetical protein
MSFTLSSAIARCLSSDHHQSILTGTMHISACFGGLLSLAVASVRASSIDLAHGVYSGSQTPSKFPWNMYVNVAFKLGEIVPQPFDRYNYCSTPHVNAAHYSVPSNLLLECTEGPYKVWCVSLDSVARYEPFFAYNFDVAR